jgi:two-component system, LytTR family, response regulator AlgR
MSLRLLFADDEPPARARLRRLLAELTDIEVLAECGAGDEAVRLVSELHPDVALLDIRMPGMSGLEAARHMALLPQPPAIVFTTAYDQYAVEAFEAEAVDYLLKPIRAERLAAALQRAVRLSTVQLARTALARQEARTQLAARLGEQIRLIPVDSVYCFIADQKYTTVRHRSGSDLIDDSLRALEEEFGQRFVRIHRNALAAVACLERIERDAEGHYSVVLRDIGERLDVSRRLAGELKERFGI